MLHNDFVISFELAHIYNEQVRQKVTWKCFQWVKCCRSKANNKHFHTIGC